MLKALVTLLHVGVSVVLILTVLLQTGKRADLAGAFGGGGSQTAFGARGTASVLSKATTACAVTFMITSLTLAIMSRSATGGGTVLDQVDAPAPVTETAPADAGDLPALPPLESAPAQPTEGGDATTEESGDGSGS